MYFLQLQVLRTFLYLQLQHVGEQVGAQGSFESSESKMKKKEMKMKILKLSKGQRKVYMHVRDSSEWNVGKLPPSPGKWSFINVSGDYYY